MRARALYESLMQASRAHAQWEIESSLNIIRNRKKLLILFVMALPLLIPAMAHAASVLPAVIGGKSSYGPSFFSASTFYGSIGIGVIAGLITGCIGAGGGFVITPALMSLGVKGILAVGTDMFHIFAKAIMGTVLHKKMGNVHYGLAFAFVIGSAIGVTGGGKINRALFNYNPVLSDFVISAIYVVLLGFLGIFALSDFIKTRKSKDTGDAHGTTVGMTGMGVKLQSINLKPMIEFDEHLGGRKISGVFVAISGAIAGFCASILGVGGGFVTFPMFVYGLGISTATTVGTDIFQIIFSAGYGSITQYALYGYVFYTLAMGCLLGSILGIQIGAITTMVVPGRQIRAFYAIAILAGFINRLFALPEKLSTMGYITLAPATGAMITNIGVWIFFALVAFFALWIIGTFVINLPKLRAESDPANIDKANQGGVSQ